MRWLALLGLLALAVAPASSAAAESDFAQISFVGGVPGGASHGIESSVKATGQVRVDFHGNGVSGTVTWSPGSSGALLAFGYRRNGQRREAGFLSIGEELGYGGRGGPAPPGGRGGGGAGGGTGPPPARGG